MLPSAPLPYEVLGGYLAVLAGIVILALVWRVADRNEREHHQREVRRRQDEVRHRAEVRRRGQVDMRSHGGCRVSPSDRWSA